MCTACVCVCVHCVSVCTHAPKQALFSHGRLRKVTVLLALPMHMSPHNNGRLMQQQRERPDWNIDSKGKLLREGRG